MLFKKLIPAILWALFILALCALPGAAIPELSFLDWLKPDKIIHLFLFAVLAFLLTRAFSEQTSVVILNTYPKLISVLFASAYGVFVELIQEYFVEGRHGDVYDSLADAVGAITGILLFNYWKRRRLAKSHG